MKNNLLDQFYTNPKVCDYLVKKIDNMFDLQKFTIFEPSAGTGNFIDSLSKIGVDIQNRCLAFDIEPKNHPLIKRQDFLTLDISNFVKNKKHNLVIGNPPFGKRASLAIEFINKSLEFADVVCMILPNTFNRYLIQSKILKDAKLIYSKFLPPNSFVVSDKPYSVNCVFQIWVNKNVKTWFSDKRLKNNNFNKIQGLEIYTHNNTKETLKYFNKEKYKWDFAIVRQGFYDYSLKITNPKDLVKNRQYIFIKTKNQYLMDLINFVDFEKLASRNTTIKGFSNTDLINEIYQLHVTKILEF